jgi:uncharacterized membrane protein YfcA
LAFLAGLVDSVVGGGGLIQIPALLLFLPPEQSGALATVLGTNKLSSMCGTSVAVVQYARRVAIPWRSIAPAAGAAFVCSALGARVVVSLRPQFLKPLVLVLLVAVAVYTFARKNFGHRHRPRFHGSSEVGVAGLIGAVIGFYDGFFGPGTGSFLIFAFIGLLGFDFLAASASAKVINLATNLAAVGYFAAKGHVWYGYALPMGACNVLGSLVGTRLALLKGNRFVRLLFLGVVLAMILRYGYEVLLK